MSVYKVELTDGQTFYFQADLVEASSNIWANFREVEDDWAWEVSPFQTADANHREDRAARLLAEYFATDPTDCTTVAKVWRLDDAS